MSTPPLSSVREFAGPRLHVVGGIGGGGKNPGDC